MAARTSRSLSQTQVGNINIGNNINISSGSSNNIHNNNQLVPLRPINHLARARSSFKFLNLKLATAADGDAPTKTCSGGLVGVVFVEAAIKWLPLACRSRRRRRGATMRPIYHSQAGARPAPTFVCRLAAAKSAASFNYTPPGATCCGRQWRRRNKWWPIWRQQPP